MCLQIEKGGAFKSEKDEQPAITACVLRLEENMTTLERRGGGSVRLTKACVYGSLSKELHRNLHIAKYTFHSFHGVGYRLNDR